MRSISAIPSDGPRPWNGTRLAGITLAVAALMSVLVFALLGWPRHGIDDADITMVYARNIAAGHGYVFTPGGERVEGSTSLLWTLLCALAFTLGAQATLILLMCLGMTVVAVATSLHLARSANAGSPDRAGVLAVLLQLACPAYYAWMTATYMDVALWCTCIVLTTAIAVASPSRGRSVWLTVACAAVVLARPEGLLVAPLLVAVAGLATFAQGSTLGASARSMGAPVLAVLVAAAGSMALRRAYFGYPFPNTYYVKIGGDHFFTALRGLRSIGKGLLIQPLHLVAGACVLRTLVVDGRGIRQRLRGDLPRMPHDSIVRIGMALLLASAAAMPLIEGEDHFAGMRMWQPFVPLSCALVASEVIRLRELGARAARFAPAAILVAALVGWVRFVHTDRVGLKFEMWLDSRERVIATELMESIRPGLPLPSVGVTPAGGFAWTYRGRVQDLLGLNWIAMAHRSNDRHGYSGHAAFSPDVFWADPPALLVVQDLGSKPRDVCDLSGWWSQWENRLLKHLLSSDRFRGEYAGVAAPTRDGWLTAFARRDWLSRQPMRDAVTLEWPAPAVSTTCFEGKETSRGAVAENESPQLAPQSRVTESAH